MAAEVPGFTGFAVGRTTFWDALVDLRDEKIGRDVAVARIAQRSEEWIAVFERPQ
jgi:myo-inositol catabolism protein IolC